jgi:hypothetical protein
MMVMAYAYDSKKKENTIALTALFLEPTNSAEKITFFALNVVYPVPERV